MRAVAIVLITAVAALWVWFAIAVGPRDASLPRRIITEESRNADSVGVTAVSLHNTGVALNERGEPGDALLYFERAHSFRPMDASLAVSHERQQAYLAKRAWVRVLVPATPLALVVLLVAAVRGMIVSRRDRRVLRRLRLRGGRWFRIRPGADKAELKFRFNQDIGRVLARHPLTIVWSSARHGKHMKSRPRVEAEGRNAVVRLEGERLERLQRCPGEWKGFLYLDGRPVGNATARVG